jgi:hypothetical protein
MIYISTMNMIHHPLRFTCAVLILCSVALLVGGCRASAGVEPLSQNQTVPRVRTDNGSDLQRLARRIITAQTSTTEANAIQALRNFETANNLTYQTQVVRLDTNTIVQSGSVQPYPLRVDVYIFQGQTVVYTFSFVPRDNRNLALMGL